MEYITVLFIIGAFLSKLSLKDFIFLTVKHCSCPTHFKYTFKYISDYHRLYK